MGTLDQGSSDGAHGCGPMRHCREDCTGPGHGYACGRWWLALVTAAVAQEDRARAHACGMGSSDGCNLGSGLQWIWRIRAWQMWVRHGPDYWRLKAPVLEAQGLGGNWNEDVWLSPSPFYKSVGQLIGL